MQQKQHGKAFTSKADTANEKQSLQIELERLRQRLQDLSNAVSTIKTSDTFEKITSIVDVSSFGNTKEEALNNLKEALKLYFEDNNAAFNSIMQPEIINAEIAYA